MEMSLTAQQDQKMLLTPHMRQSMEILQMSSLDLHEWVKQQMNDNPFIELRRTKERPAIRQTCGTKQEWWLNADHTRGETLETVLLEQLACMTLDSFERALCKWMIGNLDERGYLLYSKNEISALRGVSIRQVGKAVTVLQSLEPHGVGAATLAECLLLQLHQQKEVNALVISLVQQDLPSIAEGKLHQLAEKYGTDLSVIKAALAQIRALNPKPGASYSREQPQYVMPDLRLKLVEGKCEVSLENNSLPDITLNAFYLQLMEQKAAKDVHRFLKLNWQAANGLMDSIERRKMTLLKTATLIFELQADFCLKGNAYIRPMTMKQVADTLQVHESTVSRTVSHKFIQTPWGMFELKHFFSSAIKHADGTSVSAFYMKERIREAIMTEHRASPFSDQQLAELLILEGLLISRRTVTKYREQMGLPPAVKRKIRSSL
ncbi:RNA polymerase factor sigma-54 [Paenibacillus aceris]|uniref:RNA polymerase sigma-54 factor n=1 Tax=Paenibacillus aceris TaxID=869555 RepID=A0ABS4HYV6_9BACL|nr:RNA polymerase factor sigma-54 [Paenibacillus aceris]MBP1963862.1 RNA polymerase sigma-54 factor [Paenibacillus aceris]NHW34717.1 RNA polymerase factor sigma-54 [Paenibacillus aceris]